MKGVSCLGLLLLLGLTACSTMHSGDPVPKGDGALARVYRQWAGDKEIAYLQQYLSTAEKFDQWEKQGSFRSWSSGVPYGVADANYWYLWYDEKRGQYWVYEFIGFSAQVNYYGPIPIPPKSTP